MIKYLQCCDYTTKEVFKTELHCFQAHVVVWTLWMGVGAAFSAFPALSAQRQTFNAGILLIKVLPVLMW